MPLTDFVKSRDADLDEQEGNFLTKFPAVAATLGIAPAEVTEVTNTLKAHRLSFTAMNEKKAEAKSFTEANRSSKLIAVGTFRRIANLIKASYGYTVSMGEDLGIIGADFVPPDPSAVKPKLKGVLSGGNVIINFDKARMEGIRLYSKRAKETEFTFLATDTHSPYTDNREKLDATAPEERQYYAFYISDENEIGQASDIITVVVP